MTKTSLALVASWAGLALLGAALAGCGDDAVTCGPGTVDDGAGRCVSESFPCGDGTVFDSQSSTCVAKCGPGTTSENGECVPDGSVICQTGTTFEDGECVPDLTGCGAGTVLVDGQCLPEGSDVEADFEEAAEPNDPAVTGSLATFAIPAVGESVVVKGCITPYDRDGDGSPDNDFDAFGITSSEAALIEVTVDGLGGMAGAFFIDDGGSIDSVERAGVNLVGDTAQRQVFIPGAFDEPANFVVVDGRYLYNTLRADANPTETELPIAYSQVYGGPDQCYFATITNLGLPTAGTSFSPGDDVTGTYLNDVVFYSYTASEGDWLNSTEFDTDDDIFASAAVSVLRNSETVSSDDEGWEGDGADNGLELSMPRGLRNGDIVWVAVDPQIVLRSTAASFNIDFGSARRTSPLPTDGSEVAFVRAEGDPSSHYFFFSASAAEIQRLDVDIEDGSDAPLNVNGISLEGRESSNFCNACSQANDYLRRGEDGLWYIRVNVGNIGTGSTYAIQATVETQTLTALDNGSTLTDQAFTDQGVNFYTLPADRWWELSADGTLTDDSLVLSYFGDVTGRLSNEAPAGSEDIGAPRDVAIFGPAIDSDNPTFLIRAHDSDTTPNGAGSGYSGFNFDLSVAARSFTDLGAIDGFGDLVTRSGVTSGEESFTYFALEVTSGFVPDLTLVVSNVTAGTGEVIYDFLSIFDESLDFDGFDAGVDDFGVLETFFGPTQWLLFRIGTEDATNYDFSLQTGGIF